MPTLSNNIENRVRKLPKPSNATQGLQPLFEAVSNAMFALEDQREKDAENGRIDIRVVNLSDPGTIEIVVSDGGIGLDSKRYDAFCEIDTDFKKTRGGKGVGRLFWLDAFSSIRLESTYPEAGEVRSRAFNFVLNNLEQVVPDFEGRKADAADCGTTVTFKGLRTK